MRHNDAQGYGPAVVPWTTIRKGVKRSKGSPNKDAEVGVDGVIANVLGGDEIEVMAKSGNWYKATVAWDWPDGAAMVRMNDSLDPEAMRTMPATTPVRWRRIRPK